MILLLVFIPRDPHITSLLLVIDDLIQALNTIIKVSLGQFKGLLNANLLSLKRSHLIDELVDFLVLVFDLRLALVEQVVFKIDDIREVFVAIMLILQLVFDLVAGLVHRVQLVNQVVMVCASCCQLLLHLVVVDLKRAKLELILIGLELVSLDLFLQLFDLGLTFAIYLAEANHLTLVLLKLTCGVLQILHERLGLLLVGVHELFRLGQLERQVLLLTHKAVIG